MCACGFRRGNPRVLANQGFTQFIPQNSFVNADTYTDFMFWHCISPNKVYDKLNTIKVSDGNGQQMGLGEWIKQNPQQNLNLLADLHNKGGDVQQYGTDVKILLSSIPFTKEELSKSECTLAFDTTQ